MKLWQGRQSGEGAKVAEDFNSSVRFDSRMYREDIQGSMAHAAMLGAQGIIDPTEAQKIIEALAGILDDIDSGTLEIDRESEDIHSFVEGELTRRIGDAGKRLHTARSRNDQVALDLRMYLRGRCRELLGLLSGLIGAVVDKAEENRGAIAPGYTHMQRAQPISFAHHLLAYAFMFERDAGRLRDAIKRMNLSPLGSCALAGTTYPTDRSSVASTLGFDGITLNSIDGVSDRDFCLEIMSALSILMMHLSRFSEEIVLWSSWEFRFVELDDDYTTGSSIMPQKKNPDMAELVRGKTGRVYGDLVALLVTMKGLPLAYNKDMQEDKEAVFDCVDTASDCLKVFTPMVETMRTHPENMRRAASAGFINATDLADYLTRKGMPFRDAYRLVGSLVAKCIESGKTLETLTLDEYRAESELFDEDVYTEINLENCVERRISAGGTGSNSIENQIHTLRRALLEWDGE